MEGEYRYQGRIAICEPRDAGPLWNQHAISGVLIAIKSDPLLSESKDWENIQCEITIRPLKRLGKSKIKGMRLDQAALNLSRDEQWGEDKSEEE